MSHSHEGDAVGFHPSPWPGRPRKARCAQSGVATLASVLPHCGSETAAPHSDVHGRQVDFCSLNPHSKISERTTEGMLFHADASGNAAACASFGSAAPMLRLRGSINPRSTCDEMKAALDHDAPAPMDGALARRPQRRHLVVHDALGDGLAAKWPPLPTPQSQAAPTGKATVGPAQRLQRYAESATRRQREITACVMCLHAPSTLCIALAVAYVVPHAPPAVHDSSARFFLCAEDADLTWAPGSSRSWVLAREGIAAPRRSYVVGFNNSQIASAGAPDADAMSCYGRPGGPWFAAAHELQASPRNPPACTPMPLPTSRAQSAGLFPAAGIHKHEEAERCGSGSSGQRRKDYFPKSTSGSTPGTFPGSGCAACGIPMEPLLARTTTPPSHKPRPTTGARGDRVVTPTMRAPSGSGQAPLAHASPHAWGALEYRQRHEHAADVQAVMDLPPL